jgi:beta-N-acetylhexosaminidase
VILYDSNLTSKQVAQTWTSQLQASAKVPLLIGADVEGGTVNRLLATNGYIPSAYEMSIHSNAAAYAQKVGQQVSSDLTALGLNNDYAPVVDVDSGVGAAGGQLGGRMFGATAGQVSKLAGAFLTGLQQSGKVVGTLKHFPGLGDVPVDPHLKLYTVTRSLGQLESVDWAPYKTLIASGQVDMIMSTHVVVQAVDPTRPASLSYPVLTGILRDQLHYNGVIITDAIYMQALNVYPVVDRILDAVEAGNDIISAAYDPGVALLALDTIHSAVQNGAITKQRIDDSVRRILALKLKYGVLSMPKP